MRKARWIAVLVALAVLEWAIPLPVKAENAPRRGGELVVSVGTGPPTTLCSALSSGYTNCMVSAQLFASPLRFDADRRPRPYLAESWEWSKDRLSLTLRLAGNATFHDGHPVTSEDVAFSVMTVKAAHPLKYAFEAVRRVDTPDARTAVIRLARPMPALLLALSPLIMPVLPEHVYGDGRDLGQAFRADPGGAGPVGSGPYMFDRYEGGDLVLRRNPDFFIPGRPLLERITFRVQADTRERVVDMIRGEAHLATFFVDFEGLHRLSMQPHLVVTDQGYEGIGAINWLAFNLRKGPFKDKRVRQAVARAVDRGFITEYLHRGRSRIATGPIAPGNPFYEADVPAYPADSDKAAALLDAAGYPANREGVRFAVTLDYAPALPSQQRAVALYIARQLERIGIEVRVRRPESFGQWVQRVSQGGFDLAMDMVSNYGDPILGVHRTYLSSNIRKGVMWTNTQGYVNPEVDRLLHRAGMEADRETRKALYRDFQRIVVDELPVLWLNVVPFRTVAHRGLEKLPTGLWGVLSPLDAIGWDRPLKAGWNAPPVPGPAASPLARIGARAVRLIETLGWERAVEVLRDPGSGFLDLEDSGLHVLGITPEGDVFLDTSGRLKKGMSIHGLSDRDGNRVLPRILKAARGRSSGLLHLKEGIPHPGTGRIGPVTIWCAVLREPELLCVLAWTEKAGGVE